MSRDAVPAPFTPGLAVPPDTGRSPFSAAQRRPRGAAPAGWPALLLTAGLVTTTAAVADTHQPTAPTAPAAPTPPPPDSDVPPPDPTIEAAAQATRQVARSAALWLAQGVDSWFGDRPFEDGGRVSDGRLELRLLQRQGESPRPGLRFNARFSLPNASRQTYLFIGRDQPDEVVTDTPGALSRQNRLIAPAAQDNAFFAGVARALDEHIDLRLGIRGPLRPYAQARWREVWTLPDSNDRVELRQTLFWTVTDHLGSTTALSYEHALTPTRTVRWVQSATFTQAVPRVAWSGLLGLYQAYPEDRLLALEGLVNGLQRSGVGASDAGVQLRWEQPVHDGSLRAGVMLGRFRPRDSVLEPRREVWALGVSVGLRF